jgi:transposase, IS6 family
MIEERGLPVNHVTIWRWVLHYARILNQRMLPELRHPIGPWQVDETYVRIDGSGLPLPGSGFDRGDDRFRALTNRDLIAAKLFLRLALPGASGVRPRVINVDGHSTYARAIAELRQSGDLRRRHR